MSLAHVVLAVRCSHRCGGHCSFLPYYVAMAILCRVTELEAARLEETRPEREAFLRQLRADIEEQARERHVTVHFPEPAPPPASEQPRD